MSFIVSQSANGEVPYDEQTPDSGLTLFDYQEIGLSQYEFLFVQYLTSHLQLYIGGL